MRLPIASLQPTLPLLLALLLPGARASETIALWTFEPPSELPETVSSPPPAFGDGTAQLLEGIGATLATGDPTGSGGRGWNTSRYPAQGSGAGTAGVRFAVPTLGWARLRLTFRHRASARAAAHGRIRVSADGIHFSEAGVFATPGPDQWHLVTVDLSGIPAAADNAAFAVEVVSDFAPATNRYAATGPDSTYATTGTWRFDDVELRGEPSGEPLAVPRIRKGPTGRALDAGSRLHLGVGASGEPPLFYQWERDGEELPGEMGPQLIRDPVTAADAGRYRVRIRNSLGEVASDEVTVQVAPPPPPHQVFDCGVLRSRLRAPDWDWPPLDSLVQVEGTVTTHVSLAAPGDLQFFLQDATGGIAVLWQGAPAEALPPAGSRVQVVGPVRQSQGLLRIVPDSADPRHAVRVIESDRPLPEPVAWDWVWLDDPVRLEALEGLRIRVSGVTLDTRSPVFPDRGTSLTLRSVATGRVLSLRVDGDAAGARVDLAGQPKPEGPFSIIGIWSQSDASRPFTEGYQVVPTRYADLLPEGRAPEVAFLAQLENLTRPGDAVTNTFNEQVLRPGESLTIRAQFHDDQGSVEPGTSTPLPDGAFLSWSEPEPAEDGLHHRTATLTFTADESHAGQRHRFTITARGAAAERRVDWTVDVPTSEERQVVLTEFLANPSARTDSPIFNPLRRDDWPPVSDAAVAARLTAWDEFVELVNAGPESVSLAGWTLSDATRTRAWVDPDHPASRLLPGAALVLYGGPAGSHPPNLPCPAMPAVPGDGVPPGSEGLGFNNSGDVLTLRNAAGRLVERVVYAGREVSEDASRIRWPIPEGPWMPHPPREAHAALSPGLTPTGGSWTGRESSEPLRLEAMVRDDQLELRWNLRDPSTYTVWESGDAGRTWTAAATNLSVTAHSQPVSAIAHPRWFRVTSP